MLNFNLGTQEMVPDQVEPDQVDPDQVELDQVEPVHLDPVEQIYSKEMWQISSGMQKKMQNKRQNRKIIVAMKEGRNRSRLSTRLNSCLSAMKIRTMAQECYTQRKMSHV